ncbi:hypothetical protein [Fluviispira vulneris]|uniref:hypothetical protein n=1 Tax=Fluviispira vulneris TaxID=2763012 RepID=UPI0016451B19|nr:hypothetical protein [Fluviispira vulneris]
MEYNQLDEEIKKNFYVLTKENAPCCYETITHYEAKLVIDVYESIKENLDIYKGHSDLACDKIRILILPALLNDGLIEEVAGGYRALHGNILFRFDKQTLLKSSPQWMQSAIDKINEKNAKNSDIVFYNTKNISRKDFEEVIDLRNKYISKVASLKSIKDGEIEFLETFCYSFYEEKE